MPQITLLSQETIDKIAAGEVVERPSSVVKELVENAIDAQATAVTVEIKEGGISFIRITDNGCGIERSQVPLAFLRHSTSKIKSVEDLLSLHSLGFRGEALSSIAAVAQVELITKTYGDLTGTRYVIEGSKEKEQEEIGAPEGTTFIVRNLFYNTPARQKFLKTAQTEGNYISDLLERLALSHPNVSFKFINNGQTRMHTSGNSSEKDIIYHIYGRDITSALLPVNAENEMFSVKGFIGKPLISRGNRNYENYFINGRYIKSALLSKAIEEAYKGFMMQHQYPFCVLYFTIHSDLLDINVHPTKMELRFANNEELYRKLYQVIRDVLTHKELIPEVPVEEEKAEKAAAVAQNIPEPFEKQRIRDIRAVIAADSPYEKKYPERKAVQKKLPECKSRIPDRPAEMQDLVPEDKKRESESSTSVAVFAKLSGRKPDFLREDISYNAAVQTAASDTHCLEQIPDMQKERPAENAAKKTYEQQNFLSEEHGFLTSAAAKKHKIIGQLFETYWLIEYEDKLFIIDQHAAHEKVLYEKTMVRLAKNEFASQAISPPVILTLSSEEEEVLEKYMDQITAFGYSIAHFGGKEYAINAVPADFECIDMRSMFIAMLDDFTGISGKAAPNLIQEKVASMSCKAAVKGNQHLSVPEVTQLIDELLELENPYHCPHGRPTIISMSKYEIEKKFKRIV